jgi:hypothetical protein
MLFTDVCKTEFSVDDTDDDASVVIKCVCHNNSYDVQF